MALLLASCGKPVPPGPPTAIHLDPRLDGGVSPARAFADAERLVGEWVLGEDPASFGPWRLVGAAATPGVRSSGVLIRGELDLESHPALEYVGAADAAAFNVIEVDLVVGRTVRSSLAWYLPGGARATQQAELRGSAQVQTLRLSMVEMHQWRGELSNLRLEPSSGVRAPIELVAIRHIHRSFEPGASPSDPSGELSGDGGVIDIDGEAYRAWPMALDDPLTCEAVVPPGGQLVFATGLLGGALELPLSLIVSVAPVDGSSGRREQVLVHPYPRPGEHRAWHRCRVDLTALEGQSVELEFLVRLDGELRERSLDRALAVIGSPLLVGEFGAARPPNVVLVTLDTTRFDALGSSFTGEAPQPGVHTPFLDELAARSLVFTDAWSAGNSTQPSHASILTGLSIQDHALFDNYGVLDPSVTTLAEILRSHGYYTAGAVSFEAIGESSGFAQGFDRFGPPQPGSNLDGRDVIDVARRWIDEWDEAGERPFFLWVHLYDPHTPYLLPDGALEDYLRGTGLELPPRRVEPPTLFEPDIYPPDLDFLQGINSREHVEFLYRVEVAYADRLLSELFGAIDAVGQMDRTLAVITADHGEHLGERKTYYSHRGLTPETLHVPLLVKLPNSVEGEYVAERVTTRDVVPTIVAQLGLDQVDPRRDLVAVARAGADPERVFWFEHASGHQVGCRDDRYHFITTLRDGFTFGVEIDEVEGRTVMRKLPLPNGSCSLYDWRADPGLTHDLAPKEPELVAEYLAKLEAYRASARPFERAARDLTEAQQDQLRALGYAGD
ncbi:sulfatase [Engelhardtia mirabilis]|uniref:sulfatase n=1 Tax=Engelhardtia mirabilis TaxID=2528011 RepID=UPI003AF3DF0B